MTPQRIGPYPIEREVGRGGMGVVYLGRDTRLDRPVAIKVLPEAFARDPERLARFEREARLLAALTHPNIAGIYGLEEADGRRFLALEYVEGETLAERLRRGPLTLHDTLDVCRQIAGALEAAHEAGIVHRDLKPGNVKLTPAGDVKVLDFGLAKSAAAGSESGPDLTQSPTLTYGATGAGVILGTAAYMSPEQARGKPVDRRTDIWSFGCLLFECLTGAQAFAGETVSDTIALILQGSADASRIPKDTPEKLRALLSRCLERDARGRLRDIGDARIELEELMGNRVSSASRMGAAVGAAGAGGTTPAATVPPARPRGRGLAFAALLLIVGAGLGAVAWNGLRPAAPETTPMRFTVQPPARVELVTDPNELAISPDGRTLVFGSVDSTGIVTLWLRPLGDFDARELPGTRNASLPFWSPDARQIGFFADGKLKRIRLTDQTVSTICDAATGRGASWSTKDVIVFGPSASGPLLQVRASGGTPVPATAVDSSLGETGHRWPSFLPDGEHFIFTALPVKGGQFASYVGSLGSMARAPLLASINGPIYAAPGYVIFGRSDGLFAQRFDPSRRTVGGDPFRIGERPSYSSFSGAPGASVSSNGVLAWQSAGNQTSRLVWLDRAGREVEKVDLPADRWGLFTLSPDGRRASVMKTEDSGVFDLWMVDLTRGVASRLTMNQGSNYAGPWSPDGKQILYGSNRGGPRDLYRLAADGSGAAEPFYHSSVAFKDAAAWSPDGKWVLMNELGSGNGWDMLLLPATGGTPTPFIVTPFNEQATDVSPDGRWVLYTSDETGSGQAFVQSFPTPGKKQQVSKTGGLYGVWSRDGREIFLVRADYSVTVIPVTVGAELQFGAPRELHRLPINTTGWALAPDGRFLATVPAERSVPGVSIAVNWRAGHEE